MKTKIITSLFIILVIFASVYFYLKKNNVNGNILNSTTQQNISSDILQYKNIERGFTLDYPKELQVRDNDEGDTTHTIVFSDSTGEKSFQVFFTPYFGTQITQSRILEDVPSGKFTTPVEIVIGGSVHALAFESTLDIGEMREVWFIYGGYLYEVSTYKDLDTWLAEIMQSWNFFTGSSAGGQ